jgi:hypothetical protein
MLGLAVLLSLGILNAAHQTPALKNLHGFGYTGTGSYEANENNGSTSSSIHKGERRYTTFVNQDQQCLNKISYISTSRAEGTIPDTCQQPFSYGSMGSVEPTSHFKKIQHFKVDYTDAQVTQYESQRTGMRVSVVDRKGPKVGGVPAID